MSNILVRRPTLEWCGRRYEYLTTMLSKELITHREYSEELSEYLKYYPLKMIEQAKVKWAKRRLRKHSFNGRFNSGRFVKGCIHKKREMVL